MNTKGKAPRAMMDFTASMLPDSINHQPERTARMTPQMSFTLVLGLRSPPVEIHGQHPDAATTLAYHAGNDEEECRPLSWRAVVRTESGNESSRKERRVVQNRF